MSVRESEDSMKADSLYCLSQELTLPRGFIAYLIFVTAQTRLQEIYIFITLQADFKGNTTGM